MFYLCENGIYMISSRGHTAVASWAKMSELQSLWGLGSNAKQIVENVFNYFYREPAADTTAVIQQTVQAAGVGLTTIYKIRRDFKSAERLFTFLKKKGKIITEQKEKCSNI